MFSEYFQNPEGPNVGHRLHDYMVPFFPLVQNAEGFDKSDAYGYVYDYINEGISPSCNGDIFFSITDIAL